MGVHRSRYELERVLGRSGAGDVAFVEADTNASIQFALEAHRRRTITAQERAYEQGHARGKLVA